MNPWLIKEHENRPPFNGEKPAIIPSPLEGEGKGEGDHLHVFTIMRLLVTIKKGEIDETSSVYNC